jgi:hypothetical protein
MEETNNKSNPRKAGNWIFFASIVMVLFAVYDTFIKYYLWIQGVYPFFSQVYLFLNRYFYAYYSVGVITLYSIPVIVILFLVLVLLQRKSYVVIRKKTYIALAVTLSVQLLGVVFFFFYGWY